MLKKLKTIKDLADLFVDLAEKISKGKMFWVDISDYRNMKSNKQLGLFFAAIFPQIENDVCDAILKDHKNRYETKEGIPDEFKRTCLYIAFSDPVSIEFMGKEQMGYKRLSDMDTLEATKFFNRIVLHWANKGTPIEMPEDECFKSLINDIEEENKPVDRSILDAENKEKAFEWWYSHKYVELSNLSFFRDKKFMAWCHSQEPTIPKIKEPYGDILEFHHIQTGFNSAMAKKTSDCFGFILPKSVHQRIDGGEIVELYKYKDCFNDKCPIDFVIDLYKTYLTFTFVEENDKRWVYINSLKKEIPSTSP